MFSENCGKANVTHAFKKEGKEDLGNYRLVSPSLLLGRYGASNLGKHFEILRKEGDWE